ncbi:MAG: glycosyltransferase family 2 protein [Thermoplasmatales archaeon]|nr:glycosyltransferase family 2 protein [Thermoplasmatales archaeon]
MKLKKTAIIFSYNDGDLVLSPLRSVLKSDVDQIFLLYGGKSISEEIGRIEDNRLIKVLERERRGKVRALNFISSNIWGDIVFLISGDVSFEPSLIKRCEDAFTGTTGVVSAKVLPSNTRNYTERVSTLMWEMHDLQLSIMSNRGSNVHAGEFLCVRKGLLRDLPEVINEDEFLCIKAANNGLSVKYLEDQEVHNFVPSNPVDLFQQRRRVNFGHIEIEKIGWDPRIMDTLVFRETPLFLEIFSTFLKKKKWSVGTLFGAFSIEFLANLSARMDSYFGKDHRKWIMVKRENSQKPSA